MKRNLTAQKAFSFPEFCSIASRAEHDFSDFGTVITQGNRNEEGSTYTFKDNGSSVLAVAHLDTVQSGSYSSIIYVKGERVLLCPRLDDRLGVYIITRMLPRMGITCDLLLTTGEEVGMSSAELFLTDKQYNWAFSFDRAGADVVLYQHHHKQLCRVLRKAGFKIGDGTFSDISSLDIGCSGINFGCGYYDPHGQHAYAKLSETFRMVDKFAEFHAKHGERFLPYDKNSQYRTMSGYQRQWWKSERYYAGKSVYSTGYSAGYPQDEKIWSGNGYKGSGFATKGQYLDWYGRHDEWDTIDATNESEAERLWREEQEEQLETLADQALREDNGK